jgi:ABC-type sugar transport system permease subunit
MKISKWTLLWLVIVLVLVLVWGSMLAGLWRATDLALNFFLIIFSLVVIAILAIIGAVFVGIFVSQRIMSAQGFTPFEREMLEMREDVKWIRERISAIEEKAGQTAVKERK